MKDRISREIRLASRPKGLAIPSVPSQNGALTRLLPPPIRVRIRVRSSAARGAWCSP